MTMSETMRHLVLTATREGTARSIMRAVADVPPGGWKSSAGDEEVLFTAPLARHGYEALVHAVPTSEGDLKIARIGIRASTGRTYHPDPKTIETSFLDLRIGADLQRPGDIPEAMARIVIIDHEDLDELPLIYPHIDGDTVYDRVSLPLMTAFHSSLPASALPNGSSLFEVVFDRSTQRWTGTVQTFHKPDAKHDLFEDRSLASIIPPIAVLANEYGGGSTYRISPYNHLAIMERTDTTDAMRAVGIIKALRDRFAVPPAAKDA